MKSALIVGGSRGIGLGLVAEHLRRGWHVTATARAAAAGLDPVASEAKGRLTLERVDITQPDDVKGLASRLGDRKFDLVFLNAGIMVGRGMTVGDVSDEEIFSIFLTNAISPVRIADRLMATAAPGATIAFMSSILGSVSTNDDGRAELYRASKAALNSLVLSFRARHAARVDITVLAIHPGVVRTSMGGPTAPLDIATSVEGVADTLERRAGSGGVAFIDYRNEVIPW